VNDDILIFGGSGSPKLTRKICEYLTVEPGAGEALRFSEGNLFVRVKETVRGRRVYLVQSTVFPANDNFMELLFWVDALKRASAESVTVVMPYFSYAKGDKKDEPRVSIRARLCADAIEVAGADRVVTLDLHRPQIQGFFRIPVDDLYAQPVVSQNRGRVRRTAPRRSDSPNPQPRKHQQSVPDVTLGLVVVLAWPFGIGSYFSSAERAKPAGSI
jgi:ribose-phosphate pyrophosphokinase